MPDNTVNDTSYNFLLAVDSNDCVAAERWLKQGVKVDAFISSDIRITRLHETALADYGTPLMIAAAKGHIKICELLLSYGASVDAESGDNHLTALHFAAEKGHKEVCQLLLENGANKNAIGREAKTPWEYTENTEIKDFIKNYSTGLCNAM